MSQLFKLRENEKGQAIVEFALILPILIMLILGMIEFGWLLNGKITLNSAAREGAREMAVTQNRANAIKRVDDAIKGSGLENIVVTFNDDNIKDTIVTVNAKLEPIIRLWIKEDMVDMESVAIMRTEN